MIKAWILAARLRTLPLVLGGSCLAAGVVQLKEGSVSLSILSLYFLTALFLQILSNFANDYGDYMKGTDQVANRLDRMVQLGGLSAKQMLSAIILFSILSLISGIALLLVALEHIDVAFIGWLLLGLLAIGAAVNYTVGKRAYGYVALGDAMVLIFFGIVLVSGGGALLAGGFKPYLILPSVVYGLLSVAVLNYNNIRDIPTDVISRKQTVANRLGLYNAVIYQCILIDIAFILWLYFVWTHFGWHPVLGLSILLFIQELAALSLRKDPETKSINGLLKFQAITTGLFGVLTFIFSYV